MNTKRFISSVDDMKILITIKMNGHSSCKLDSEYILMLKNLYKGNNCQSIPSFDAEKFHVNIEC